MEFIKCPISVVIVLYYQYMLLVLGIPFGLLSNSAGDWQNSIEFAGMPAGLGKSSS